MNVSYMFLDEQPQPQPDFSLTSVLDDVNMYITIASNTSPTITFRDIYL